jgi:hypothetical protein
MGVASVIVRHAYDVETVTVVELVPETGDRGRYGLAAFVVYSATVSEPEYEAPPRHMLTVSIDIEFTALAWNSMATRLVDEMGRVCVGDGMQEVPMNTSETQSTRDRAESEIKNII